MWAILLKVFSIIGIVLGSIIGLVLVLLLIVLLCPIVYKISGSAKDGDYNAKVKLHYLFGIVRAGFTYPEPGNLYVRVLWFRIFDTKQEDKKFKTNKGHIDFEGEEPEDFIKHESVTDQEDNAAETIGNTESVDDTKTADNITGNAEATENIEASKESDKAEKLRNKDNKKDKIRNPFYHIKKAYENFKHKVIAKIKLKYKDINFYKKLLFHDDTKALISESKKALVRILKQMAPKGGHANLELGMDSPDITAYIYGVYSIVFLKKAKKYVLVPNFENKIIEGEGKIYGFFNLFGIVIQVIPIVLGKKLKLLRDRLDRHSDNMERAKRKVDKEHDNRLKELEEEYSA
jgi:hypothetical protein